MKTIEYDPTKIKFLPTLQRHEPFIMDSSSRKTLMKCRRMYFYKHVLGRVPFSNKNQPVLDFGTAYHKFRELLETKGYAAAIAYVMTAKLTQVDPKSKWGFLDSLRLVKTCQLAYENWQKEKTLGKIEVIAVEQPFNCEISPGVFIGGKADQIIKWNGRLWGRDWKTTTKDKSVFTKQVEVNDQVSTYIVGESEISGQEVQGIIFDVVYNAKTVGPEFYTVLQTRNPLQKEQWKKEIEWDQQQLAKMREEDFWPMDTPGYQCEWCDYHKVCRSGNPASMEAILRTEYKFDPWDHTKADNEE